MKILGRLLLMALLLGFAHGALAQDAAGAGSASGRKISAALLLGYGGVLNQSDTTVGYIYGLGLGLRGGYNVTNALYLGARFQYNLGGSNPFVDYHSMLLGAEGGYDLRVADKLLVRSALGLGAAITTASFPHHPAPTGLPAGHAPDTSSTSNTYLYLLLGGAVFYDVAQNIFLGAHLDLPLIFASKTVIGLDCLLTGGMRF